jgi:hypothetical protein
MVQLHTGGDGSSAKSAERNRSQPASRSFYVDGRFGANPKPTVIVRMKEEGRLPRRHCARFLANDPLAEARGFFCFEPLCSIRKELR